MNDDLEGLRKKPSTTKTDENQLKVDTLIREDRRLKRSRGIPSQQCESFNRWVTLAEGRGKISIEENRREKVSFSVDNGYTTGQTPLTFATAHNRKRRITEARNFRSEEMNSPQDGRYAIQRNRREVCVRLRSARKDRSYAERVTMESRGKK
ncbi:hypothetical protein Trydic_g6437 [Trypoxylus dichotomus]